MLRGDDVPASGASAGPKVISLGAGPRPAAGPKVIAIGAGPGPRGGVRPMLTDASIVRPSAGIPVIRAADGPTRENPIKHMGSRRIVTAGLDGDHKPHGGDRVTMKLRANADENKADGPTSGKVYTLQGDEDAEIKRHNAQGDTMGIRYAGKGGLGLHHAPGEATPRAAMFANADIDGTIQRKGQAAKGVGLRLKGDGYFDPNRNINHVDRNIDGGVIGIKSMADLADLMRAAE